MDPDELERLLGPDHNVPRGRIREICEAFDREARQIAQEAVLKHESRYHLHEAYPCDPKMGTEEWQRLRAN